MNWIKKALIPVIVITISCFFSVFLFEIGLRLANHNNPWIKTEEANILRDFQFSYDVSGLYKSDSLSVNYVRNKYGL